MEEEDTKPEIPKKKRVVIALPGDSFSSKFLISWTSALNVIWESQKYDMIVSPGVSSYVTFARMQTLGLDVLRGVHQKPFNNLDFDVWVTIDSDIIFSPQQLIDLIESTELHPVVSGMYRMSNLTNYAIVKEWNTDFFIKNGFFEFITPEFVDKWKQESKTCIIDRHIFKSSFLFPFIYKFWSYKFKETIFNEKVSIPFLNNCIVCEIAHTIHTTDNWMKLS